MIETKILGSAVGIQYQGVIDKSEGTDLPSLANGVIVGKFKRGRMDKPFKVTAKNYQALLGRDPSNPSYLAVEDAFKRGVSEVSILRVGQAGGAGAGAGGDGKCKPAPSEWSNPITFDMVNHPNSGGFISVDFGSPDLDAGKYLSISTGVDLSEITTIEEFFAVVNNRGIYDDSTYHLGVRSNGDGSISIRVESKGDYIPPDNASRVVYAAKQYSEFYVYDKKNIGNMAETQIDLMAAFSNPVIFSSCEYVSDNQEDGW